jgi:isopentenyl diphosphate isomerase/L-lactate dehydrogenase-like FMN-dependent dehydrogenase
MLHPISQAVGKDIEIVLDGGVRRGSDVVKALALGARAVMVGRAYLWGLAANGQAGVENVLDILRGGIDSAVLGLGHKSVQDLGPDDVLIPADFSRSAGYLSVPKRAIAGAGTDKSTTSGRSAARRRAGSSPR